MDFNLMWKDELIAEVHFLDGLYYIKKYSTEPIKQWFAEEMITKEKMEEILSYRCWDKARPDLEYLLQSIGLTKWDVFDIVKKTRGKMYDDFSWIKFNNENISYLEIKEQNIYV